MRDFRNFDSRPDTLPVLGELDWVTKFGEADVVFDEEVEEIFNIIEFHVETCLVRIKSKSSCWRDLSKALAMD